jgi:hypothetical protein
VSATLGLMRAERTCAVAAAAAHDLNEELTVILSALSLAVISMRAEKDHPAYAFLLETMSASQRCAWKVSGLLNFTARYGARGNSHTMERTIEESR